MIIYTTSKSIVDLAGIIELQKSNLPSNLSEEEMASEGLVTVMHRLKD